MTLPQAEPKVPTAIGDIGIDLVDHVAPADQEGLYSVQVLDANGDVMKVMTGDILPHLSNADKTWLSDFLNRMRAKAVAEILP